ncbi:MAG: mannose-6-phosphate isomerase, class I [Flavobacteriaceae bacterium]|nr:mannose-6-phosphate isomerase, class I [Flavobacteriaceae bacterium]
MSKIVKLKGVVQNYAWGGFEYIPNLLGKRVTENKCAEYWLGAHVNAPSKVILLKGEQSLDTFLNADLRENLGIEIAKKFGRLPFLLKVLDVKEVLSIQVHPSKKEAEKGFKHENELGIPLNAPHRNYKDDNHKSEIMVALSEFWLLHGFLPKDKLTKILNTIPEFTHLIPVFDGGGYFELYKKVMEESVEETNKMLRPLIDKIMPLYLSGKLEKSDPAYWAAKAIDSSENKTNLDKGIYSIYFFNIVKANKGEAVFQKAGIPHAYLEGQNMELMTNSDNVLRGGLTPKHVDVQELLKHVIFEETSPNIMLGELQNDGLERIYKSPAPDFELSQITLAKSELYNGKSKTAQILFVIDGSVLFIEEHSELKVGQGEAVLILAGSQYQISSTSSTVIYKATAP